MRPVLLCAVAVLPIACMTHSPYETDPLAVFASPDGSIVDIVAAGDTLFLLTSDYRQSSTGSLLSVNKDGSGLRTLVAPGERNAQGVTMVKAAGRLVLDGDHLYVASTGGFSATERGTVYRICRDGNCEPQVLAPRLMWPCGLSVAADRVLWSASQLRSDEMPGSPVIQYVMNGTAMVTEVIVCTTAGCIPDNQSRPASVILYDGFFYYTTAAGNLFRFSAAATGSVTPEPIAPALGDELPDKVGDIYLYRDLWIRDGVLFWPAGNAVWTMTPGSPSQPVALGRSDAGWAVHVRLAGSEVYWSAEGDNPDESGLYRATIGGDGTSTRIVHGKVSAFAVDDDYLYFGSDYDPSVVYRIER